MRGPGELILYLLAAFLAGSIPTGYLIGRLFFGVDIRTRGSGNIGMTNVWRVFGAPWGMACFLVDVAKGLIPVLIYRGLAEPGGVATLSAGAVWVGVAAVLGHTFTPWLRFRGGKGIATGLGVLIGWLGAYALVPFITFLVVLLLFRIVSLASISGGVAFVALCFYLDSLANLRGLSILMLAFILWTHRSNLARLVRGEEPRISLRLPGGAKGSGGG